MGLWWISGGLGVGMGHHRLLTHRGYKTYKWVEHFLTTCGTLALEGGPIWWVATHRVHQPVIVLTFDLGLSWGSADAA
jgi:fatty-acid desaturase